VPPRVGFKDSANTIKSGAVLSLDGKLFVVEASTHVEKGAQGKAFYNFELTDMRSGAKKNLRVPPSEKLELVSFISLPLTEFMSLLKMTSLIMRSLISYLGISQQASSDVAAVPRR
jgi:hypothetical protein